MKTGTVLWTPAADVRERARIGDYLRWLESNRGLSFADYHGLWSWSVTELEDFWQSVWDYFDVQLLHLPLGEGRGEGSRTRPTAALTDRRMPGAGWFPGAALNYAEHSLRHAGDGLAVVARSQTRAADVRLTGT
ncbi:MAG: hypothetical protein M3547_02845, partial [Acidobacteriota bacterium]|nr:hypothetical protein [Acidobacteriota bacterium]